MGPPQDSRPLRPPRARKAPPSARLLHGQLAEVSRLLAYRLAMLFKTAHVHRVGNDALRHSFRAFAELCNELQVSLGEVSIQGDVDAVFVGHQRVRPEPLMFDNVKRMLGELHRRGLGGLVVRRPIQHADARLLLQAILRHSSLGADEGAVRINAELKGTGIEGIEVLPHMALVSEEDGASSLEGDRVASVRETYSSLLVHIRAFHQYPGRVPDLVLERTQAHLRRLVDDVAEVPDLVLAAATYRSPPDYVHLHSVHMAVLSLLVGISLDMPRRNLLDLAGAALYADCGMKRLAPGLVVPEEGLDDEEMALLRTHPRESVREILRHFPLAGTGRDRLIAAFEHHVPVVGQGYPERLEPRPLHIFSRILAVADAYDAFTSDRPGGGASLTPPEAVARLAARRERFDPVVLKAFQDRLGPYPVGTCLLLSDGSVGVVRASPVAGRDPLRPCLLRAVLPGGRPADGRPMDLSSPAWAGVAVRAPVRATLHGIEPWHVLRVGAALDDDALPASQPARSTAPEET